jgi:uroporphyrinogen decarboxylase
MSNRFMTRSSDKKSIIRALKGEDLPTTPVWLMRQAGRYLPEYREIRGNVSGFLELCYTPELAVEVTLQPIRRYGLDAAILFSDILVIPDALGQSVRFLEGEGPKLDPVRDVAGIEALSEDGLHEHLAPVYETLRGLTVELPPDVTLIGFAGAPWTVATYMVEGGGSRDFAITRKWGLLDPKGFSRLIDLVTRATTAYLCRQVEEGAEVLQIFDSWAGVLSEGEFDDWVIGPTIRIVSAVKARHPGIPIIGFPRGAGVLYERYVTETGVDAVSLDSTVPLDWAARRLQDKVALQGNLDPLLLLGGGEVMEREIHRILESLGSGPFVFNLGHGIIKETSPDNVARLVEVVRGG